MQEKEQTKGKQRADGGNHEKSGKGFAQVGAAVLKRTLQTGSAVIIFVAALYTGAVFAHGKVDVEEDICTRTIGENMIHLSVYQPQVDETGHYCTDIPKAGNTLLVVDLVNPELREMPIGMKLLKGSNEEDGEVVANIRAAFYKDGVITTEQVLEEGEHLLIITAEGLPPLKYYYHLRVEMINYGDVFRATIGPVVGLLLMILIAYKVSKSKRFKNWLATRRKKKT